MRNFAGLNSEVILSFHVHMPSVNLTKSVYVCVLPYSSIRRNSRRPRIVVAQSKALERNKRRPQTVAGASKRGTRTRVRMISDDGQSVTTPALGLCCTSRFHD